MPFAERRRCARLPLHANARLRVNELEHAGLVVDISLWGALFAMHGPPAPPPDHDCRLNLLDSADRLMLSLPGMIVHSGDQQAGILFRCLDGKAVHGLKRVTESRLGAAALLHRPLPALLR